MSKNGVAQHCPIVRGVSSVGDAWSLLILREAHVGATRFDQFRKNLGIAPTMLTKRLAALTGAGLLEKRLYSERPPREEYVLTPAGQDFLPILLLFGAWARRHCDGDFARFIDETTGHEIEPVGVDAVSGERLGSRPIKVSVPGNLEEATEGSGNRP